MRHLVQKPKECYLTSMAMFLDKSIDEIRSDFEAFAGRPFHEMFSMGTRELWLKTEVALLKKYSLRLQYKSYALYVPACSPSMPGGIDRPATHLTKNKLRGKGVLSFWCGKIAHSVAFEDTIVYDPEAPGPLPYKEWRRYIREQFGSKSFTRYTITFK